MNAEYLILLGVILIFPLIFSFDANLRMYEHRRALVFAVVGMCLPFWLWDCVATWRGHWSFNPHFTLGVGLLGMPVEEWLFFPIVGFVSIFTWESVKYFTSRRGRK